MAGKPGQISDKPTVPTGSPLTEAQNDGWRQLDKRAKFGKECQKRANELQDSLGGRENLSPQRRQLIKRAAFADVLIGIVEVQFADGDFTLLNQYVPLCNLEKGLLTTLGLDRKAKTVGALTELIAKTKGHQS